jgi:N-methylhydantoinase A
LGVNAKTDRAAALGVDVGGTFTDIVLEAAGRRHTAKVPTTPARPVEGVLAGIAAVLAAAEAAAGDIGLVIHGTTLLTNALIERKGPAVAFLTTAGHRDTLEIATESRFHLYDLAIEKPRPLVPRELRFPVRERLDAAGEVLQPLDEGDVAAAGAAIRKRGVAAVAIGFLHSYVNACHERRAAEILRRDCPDVALSLSADVAPEIREYERFNTACADAFVRPLATAYLGELDERLRARGVAGPLFLMHSGGGMIDLAGALERPIRLLESGPAGGALFAAGVARALGLARAIGFDMGGTTAKLGFIQDGKPRQARSFEVDRAYRQMKGSGLPLRLPVIDLIEIGAGGGSIAARDRLGGIAVGPASAGAEPGPACYGRGGARPTVTDADHVIGRIAPSGIAAGTMRLDRARAEAAIAAEIARPLGLETAQAAAGIVEIVDENMANAARLFAQENGLAPGDCTLIAFGGAGPLHAARLAEKLGIGRIVVPADAGVGSAVGFLHAPLAFDLTQSRPMRLDAYAPGAVAPLLADMRATIERLLSRAGRGEPPAWSLAAFLRYVGQGHEVEVALPGAEAPPRERLGELFEIAYTAIFGRRVPQHAIEILSWRLGGALAPAISAPPAASRAATAEALAGIDSPEPGALPAFDKAKLAPGASIRGPSIIIDRGATIFVPPGFSAGLTPEGHVSMLRQSKGNA